MKVLVYVQVWRLPQGWLKEVVLIWKKRKKEKKKEEKKKLIQAQHNNCFQDGSLPVLLENSLRLSVILSDFHLALQNNVLLILVRVQAKYNSCILLSQPQAGIIANQKYLSASGKANFIF